MDELSATGAWSVDQADLEQNLHHKASELLKNQTAEVEKKRLEKTQKKLDDIRKHIRTLKERVSDPRTRISQKEKIRNEITQLETKDIQQLERDQSDILARINGQGNADSRIPSRRNSSIHDGGSKRLPDETEHEFLVRTGKITPFASTTLDFDQEEVEDEARSHRDLARPALMLQRDLKRRPELEYAPKKKQNLGADGPDNSDVDYVEDSEVVSEPEILEENHEAEKQEKDDGVLMDYKNRLKRWVNQREMLRESTTSLPLDQTKPEWELPHPTLADAVIDARAGFRVPGDVWASLFNYQKTAVRWMWELYSQRTGGIIGDEMGLGKTVQVAAFLAGLHYSGMLNQPALIVCPATVLHQWVSELHQWWPPLRVAILHSIGTGMAKNLAPDSDLDETDFESDDSTEESLSATKKQARSIIESIFETGHVVVTTYAGIKVYRKHLTSRIWGYCCLDEGHKIRNPNAEISLACKQIKTPYRLILSGTPIQNNLTELWSLFDFIFPGKLGTLPVFQNQFSVPINLGGYANATNIQVQTAYKCAVVLRNMIAPYMLRRMKSDVATDLPQKTEKVLFCKMTRPQKEAYTQFLKSDEMSSIMKGKRQVLYGVDILRKICNHPDLLVRNLAQHQQDYGNPAKSGKMQVVKVLLNLWLEQGHRALVFTQTRQMLDILESFLADMDGQRFMRMDGATPIGQRQKLVDQFNNNTAFTTFLLTTKVGGLGVNLTGADRVIIFDPDWNPSTDVQARERVWRLGQKKEVMIYRLMIAGSIEEKIYHRQIFKQFLTNKILKDPRQKRFFKNSDLHDLFSLGSGTESDELFGQHTSEPAKARAREKSPEEGNAGDDLSSLIGIQKEDRYKLGAQEDASADKKSSDEGLLEGIFAKAGVQSTLEHDAVLDSSRPDTVLMEREASRIANQAIAALKESRKETRRFKIGTPTWTGKFGKAGRKADSGSSSVLDGLRQKRDLESKTQSEVSLKKPQLDEHAQNLSRIRDYFVRCENTSAKSADIVKAVGLSLQSDQDVANLRQLLRRIATWSGDTGSWKLREEFT